MSFYTYSKYQIVWTTSQASRDTTSNSLEQFQLVDNMFQLFASVLYWFLGLKYKHVGLKVIFFIGSIKLLDVPRYQIVWTTSQASRDATSNYLEQFQLVDSKFKLFAPVITRLCTFRTSYPSPISLYWNPKCLDLGATRVRNPWCLVPTSWRGE